MVYLSGQEGESVSVVSDVVKQGTSWCQQLFSLYLLYTYLES